MDSSGFSCVFLGGRGMSIIQLKCPILKYQRFLLVVKINHIELHRAWGGGYAPSNNLKVLIVHGL